MIILVTLLLAIGWSICPIEAFIPTRLLALGSKVMSFSSKDAIIHPEMTRNALLEVAVEVLKDNPNPRDSLGSTPRLSALSSLDEDSILIAYYGYRDNGKKELFEDAVEVVQDANSNVDSGEEKDLPIAHFDSEQFEGGQNRLLTLRQSVVSSIHAGKYDTARRESGRMFHTLQDFYSHSNWVENGNQAPNHVLGRANQRIDNVAGPTQQTCTDCEKKGWPHYYECNNNILESLKENGILTSGYYGDPKKGAIPKPSGKCSHGGFIDDTWDTFARGGINKDGPYIRISPHYYLHYEAAAVAQQATADLLRNLRREVNNDQLFGEYLGVFESQASAERGGSWTYPSLEDWNRNAMLQHHLNRIEGKVAYIYNELHLLALLADDQYPIRQSYMIICITLSLMQIYVQILKLKTRKQLLLRLQN